LKPRRVSVLLNAASGKSGNTDRDRLRVALDWAFRTHEIAASLAFINGQDLRAKAELAVQKVAEGEFDAIVIGGGDGTVGTVAGVLAGTDVPLGIIPLGTLNHFAKDLKIPLDLEEAVALMAAGEVHSVDVGEVNGRIFINNSSIGLYPYLVVERDRRRRRAGLPKWLAMIPAVLRALRYFPVRRLSIRAAGAAEAYRSPCVFVGNNIYRIKGPSLGTRDRLDEGQLSVYVARQQSRLALLWLSCRAFFGFLDEQRDLGSFNVPAVEISSRHRQLLVSFDGEIETMRSPLHYRIRPRALRVFAPSISP
jgi:diacylglycerol kinase family enzyme